MEIILNSLSFNRNDKIFLTLFKFKMVLHIEVQPQYYFLILRSFEWT